MGSSGGCIFSGIRAQSSGDLIISLVPFSPLCAGSEVSHGSGLAGFDSDENRRPRIGHRA